jgi:hypothetical protein
MTLELNELERAALLALVGLSVSVMQNDEENGREFIKALSQEGMEGVCKELIERLNKVIVSA